MAFTSFGLLYVVLLKMLKRLLKNAIHFAVYVALLFILFSATSVNIPGANRVT